MNKIFVVEGKKDEELLKKIDPNLIVITTGGLGYGEELLEKLQNLERTHEIVLILDPDYPGSKIRRAIEERLVSPKHIFIPKEMATSKKRGRVGLEYVNVDDLRIILENEVNFNKEASYNNITISIMSELGLTGKVDSSSKRELVANHYNLPISNTKRLMNYLNRLNVKVEELEEVLDES